MGGWGEVLGEGGGSAKISLLMYSELTFVFKNLEQQRSAVCFINTSLEKYLVLMC